MTTKTKFHRRRDCEQTRLAESSVAAVDLSDCGMMQLHIGPLTVRMAPCAASELARTLERAIREFERKRPADAALHDAPLFGGGRGSA